MSSRRRRTPRHRRHRAGRVPPPSLAVGLLGGHLAEHRPRPGRRRPLPKTLVFSPLSLAPPALKGLSEGVQAYGKSKGWQVLVQDPNFDPQQAGPVAQQRDQLRRRRRPLGHRGQPGRLEGHRPQRPGQGHPAAAQRRPGRLRLHRAAARHHLRRDRLQGRRHRARPDTSASASPRSSAATREVLFAQSAVGTAGKDEIENTALAALKAAAPNAKIVPTIIAKDRAGVADRHRQRPAGPPGHHRGHVHQRRGRARCARRLRRRRQEAALPHRGRRQRRGPGRRQVRQDLRVGGAAVRRPT